MNIVHKNPIREEHGLTVVELLVVMVVSGILATTVTAYALNFWGSSASLENSQETLVTRLNSGDYLRELLDSSGGLITQNDIQDNNVGKPEPTDSTGKYWLIMHAVPTTFNMGANNTIVPVLYTRRPSIDTSKNIVLNGTIPYEDNVLLYLNGTTKQLLARTLSNTGATNNRAKTSCPKSVATNNCPADVIVAENVKNVATRYFSRSGNTIDYTSITDPATGKYIGPDYPSVEVVELNITFYLKARLHNAGDSTNQTVIRVALRNY